MNRSEKRKCIAVNARYLNAGKMDGIGWFSHEVLRWLGKEHPEVDFHVIVSAQPPADRFGMPGNIVFEKTGPPTKHALLNFFWFEGSVRRILERVKPDAFLSLDGIACLGWKGLQYCIIHDLNFMHIPTDFKPSNRIYYRWIFPKSAHRAARLGTVSEYSKADIAKTFSISTNAIDVVYSATKSDFRPVTAIERMEVQEKWTGGAPYFIFVGTLIPRKNIYRLMQAFEMYKRKTGRPEKLVLAGAGLLGVEKLQELQREMQYGSDVIFTGRVPQDALNGLIGSAVALTFISYFEGFGVPVLEAMACGVPCLISNATSLPEIAGEAALPVSPFDVEAIASCLEEIATDEPLREKLIRAGEQQYRRFSWEETSRRIWNGVEKMLG